MKRILLSLFFGVLFCTSCTSQDNDDNSSIIVKRLTNDKGKHQAFTDLVFFNNQFFLVFRESDSHALGTDGIVKMLSSSDGKKWTLIKEFNVSGIDLRDPKFSQNNGKLMLYIHGSTYTNKELTGFSDYISYYSSTSGWKELKSVVLDNVKDSQSKTQGNQAWPWRITWFENKAYSVGYNLNGIFDLYVSNDGEFFRKTNVFKKITNLPNEATIRISKNGEFFILARRSSGSAIIGKSKKPELEWDWFGEIPVTSFGGPNFLLLDQNKMLVSGREGQRLILGVYDVELNKYKKLLELPSGGDCSYAGMILKDNILWMSYYSAHENQYGTSIYLSQIDLNTLDI